MTVAIGQPFGDTCGSYNTDHASQLVHHPKKRNFLGAELTVDTPEGQLYAPLVYRQVEGGRAPRNKYSKSALLVQGFESALKMETLWVLVPLRQSDPRRSLYCMSPWKNCEKDPRETNIQSHS